MINYLVSHMSTSLSADALLLILAGVSMTVAAIFGITLYNYIQAVHDLHSKD